MFFAVGSPQQRIRFIVPDNLFRLRIEPETPPDATGDVPQMRQSRRKVSRHRIRPNRSARPNRLHEVQLVRRGSFLT